MLWLKRFITLIFCLFVALPILWLVYAAFLPAASLSQGDITQFGFSLKNFAAASQEGIWQALRTSLLASSLTVLGQLIIGLMTAYAIRQGFKIFAIILAAMALPLEVLMVPLYLQLQLFHLLDSFAVLIIPFLVSPLTIFLLSQAMRRLPQEIFESAKLDGASDLSILWRIVAPLLRPEILAAGILSFAAHWNLVLYPKIMADDPSLYTVQLFLNNLLRNHPLDWGVLGAASLIATLPLMLIYIFFEERIVKVFESSFK
ncbi:MAG: carbohydrate ABC transporter permease [Deinococcales bacterium]